MKRHSSLAHLSREHHGALILARLLQKNAPLYKDLPSDTNGKADYAFKFYHSELLKHFEEEEKVLKLVEGINKPLDLMIGSILHEHQELHSAFKSINNHPEITMHLDKIGKLLENHVRKEERQLFPLIEDSCDEEIMAAIDKSLTASLN